jgi:ribosomal protein L35
MKTYKALAKRVKITASGKIIKRKAGQDHFNSRESGNTTR